MNYHEEDSINPAIGIITAMLMGLDFWLFCLVIYLLVR